MEYYQVYVDGKWHGDFQTYEEAMSYVNSLGCGGMGCDIQKVEELLSNN